MRSSYFSFIQFYVGTVVLMGMVYWDYSLLEKRNISDYLDSMGIVVLILLLTKIKYLRIINNEVKIINPLGFRTKINISEVKDVRRVYSQICWLELRNGKRVFFMQRFFHTYSDLFLSKDDDSYLDRFRAKIIIENQRDSDISSDLK